MRRLHPQTFARSTPIAILAILLPLVVLAQDARIDILIDNDAVGTDYRDASWGNAEGGDFLRLVNGSKMPVNADHARIGSTSGVLEYRHTGGSWDLFIAGEGWPEYNVSDLDSLVFYLNAPEAVTGAELPRVGLEDGAKTRSTLVAIEGIDVDGDASTWQRVAISLDHFRDSNGFDITRTQTVRFAHGLPNPEVRTLWVDDIHIIGVIEDAVLPPPPTNLETRDGDRSVIIRWQPPSLDNVAGYRIYRAEGPTEPLEEMPTGVITRNDFVDVDVDNGRAYRYAVRSVDQRGVAGAFSDEAESRPVSLPDEAFVELIQRTAFDYFWYEAHPETGQVPDRTRPNASCSIAATGMGLSAVTIGIDNGWISREEGRARILTTLTSLFEAPQGAAATGTSGHRGFFYHFLDCGTATRSGSSELSTIDTALLMGGVLHVAEYFNGEDAPDAEVRALAESIYERVEWDWAQVRPPLIGHGWSPESGHIRWDYGGYNEAMILYLLALGSPTHSVEPDAWAAFTSTYSFQTHYGHSFVIFPPLFGHQYSHLWFDFRGIADARMRGYGLDYFENSRRATLANRAYAIDNPNGYPNYGDDEWGFTASDVPGGYLARGAPPAQSDEGTIAPTAPGGSFAFTPEESLAALRAMYDRYRTQLWGPYGFRDAYNVQAGWFAPDHIGIDQGPFVISIANHLNGRVWEVFMRSEPVRRGLERAGFEAFAVSAGEPEVLSPKLYLYPNPSSDEIVIDATLEVPGSIIVNMYDILGRHVATVEDAVLTAGRHAIRSDVSTLASGRYFIRVETPQGSMLRVFIKP